MRAASAAPARLIVVATAAASFPEPGSTIVDSLAGRNGAPGGPSLSQRAVRGPAQACAASKREPSTASVTPGGVVAALSINDTPAGRRTAHQSDTPRPPTSPRGTGPRL